MKSKKKQGIMIIEQISFEDIKKRKVIKNNSTSGKVNVPKKWIGQEIYIVKPKKEQDMR